MLINPYCQ